MESNAGPGGLEALGDLSLGTHFCLFYESQHDLIETLALYFKAGLANHELCLWITPESAERSRNILRRAIIGADDHLGAGTVETLSWQEYCCDGDKFDAGRALLTFDTKLRQALDKGYLKLRILADQSWLRPEHWKAFSDFEREINERFAGKPISIVCAYPTSSHTVADILDIARTHRFVAAKQNGSWEVLEAPDLKNIKAEHGDELENRVQRRTANLTHMNQALQAEIIEHRQSEEALRRSEARLQTAIEASSLGLWTLDVESGQIASLGHHDELFGFGPGEFDGTLASLDERIHRDDLPELKRLVQQAQEEGSEYKHEYRVVWPDGSIHWLQGLGQFIHHEVGQPAKMYGAVLDITERKRADQALRKSEQVLREAQALGHTGTWEQDLITGEIFNTNENARLFFGEDHGDGTSFDDYAHAVHPNDREYVLERRAQLLRGGPGDIEYRVVWPDGSVHVIFGRATVVRDELGQAIRVYGTNVDITERKQAEDAFRQSQELLRLVLETLPVGIFVVNQADDVILVNDASKRIWGGVIIPGHERRGQSKASWHDSGKRIAPTEWASVRALSDGQTTLNELLDIETFDGYQKTIHNSVAPVRNPQGHIVGAVIVNEDVSERVRADEEMRRQAARAETLARIAARLNRHLDLNAVVQAVCQEIVDTFKVSQAAMSLYDEPSDLLVYAGGVNIPAELASAIEPTSRAHFDALLQELGPIMVVPDIQAVPDAPNAEFDAHLDVRTVVTAAMLRDGDLIGVVAFGINGHIREFSQDELSLLKAISDQAAQALANAQLLKAAKEQQEQLRALSAKLVDAQEEERLAVARDLHDDIGQSLTGLVMQLGTVKSLLPKSAKSARSILEQSETLLQETLERARSIIRELRPPVLDDLGLIPALQRVGDDFRRNTGVQVDISPISLMQRLPALIELSILRIVQEALTNVRKHSRARHVGIDFNTEGAAVTLSVQDDGIGFDKRASRPRGGGDVLVGEDYRIPAGHYGLVGIQERVTMLGGRLQITSSPGHGTTLRVTLPLTETKAVSHEDL